MIDTMKMKDAIISIKGTQKDAGTDPESIELVTAGQYGFEDGRGCFVYDESELTGLDGTETTFTIDSMGVIMSRRGGLNSQMFFNPGKKHYFIYSTPFGSTTLGVDTHHLKTEMHEDGCELEIDYDIDCNHNLVGHNQFRIQVKENRQHV